MPTASPGQPTSPIREAAILLVDDEQDIVFVLRRLVAALETGYPIVTATDGPDALSKLAVFSIPLVIADYNMPAMNGLQLTQAIKESSPDTKIIMVSAFATPELEQRAGDYAVDYFLPKPFSFDRLEQIVREVLA
jgi:two-component system response regulator (stage 0 sporulation protein F)